MKYLNKIAYKTACRLLSSNNPYIDLLKKKCKGKDKKQ